MLKEFICATCYKKDQDKEKNLTEGCVITVDAVPWSPLPLRCPWYDDRAAKWTQTK